ncbi:MAG: indole-3-glycerol-phosphate synthase [Firmicutes bacterium]|nr:indole-3-glycerol-phosphate synthase [Bacillota bacterium]
MIEQKTSKIASSYRFTEALRTHLRAGTIPVIPDIKCKSPKEGDLLGGRDPIQLAKSLARAGAPVISVVTETNHFGGCAKLLRQIAQATEIPVLRKDFITTRAHLRASVEMGASAILLIAAMLEKKQLLFLIEEAMALGLEPLVEVHQQEELQIIAGIALNLIGINNRKIMTGEMDNGNVSTTEQLAGFVPANALLVSESGIASSQDVERAKKAGAQAVLVGTAIIRNPDPVRMYQQLSKVESMR